MRGNGEKSNSTECENTLKADLDRKAGSTPVMLEHETGIL